MSAVLDQALKELRDLPADAQEAIAHDLLETIRSEAKWDRLFADPRSNAVMDRMVAKVREDISDGGVIDSDPSSSDRSA
jgi:hypothetical protein